MTTKIVKVVTQSDTGRNTKFEDCITGSKMTRPSFVSEIKKGNYDFYYVRKINGLETPVSKPDGKKKNNLG